MKTFKPQTFGLGFSSQLLSSLFAMISHVKFHITFWV